MELDRDGDVLVQRRPALAHPPAPARDEELVLSEVHMECLLPAGTNTSETLFTTTEGEVVASIQHSMATPLGRVGLQVWRGALLLADYILHLGAGLRGTLALELGAGPGLAGLALARLAHTVWLTDVGEEVLANCKRNVEQQECRQELPAGRVHVRQLDWLDPPDWLLPDGGSSAVPESGTFGWQADEVQALQQLDYLLAADCVYDDHLTEAFMRSAVLLMQYARRHSGRSPRLLVALERRVVFTLVDQAARAPAYDYWQTLFAVDEPAPEPVSAGHQGQCSRGDESSRALLQERGQQHNSPAPAGSQQAALDGGSTLRCLFPLIGRQLDVCSVPQSIPQYQRGDYLELWELTLADPG